jgi:transketolase
MIEEPVDHIQEYIDARCDIITVHAETCTEESFSKITSELLKNGISPGIAINPSTNIPGWLYDHLPEIDVIIVMSVNPGSAGQKFIPDVLGKMRTINQELREHNFIGYLEADGGIDSMTLRDVYDAGARIMVAGSAVYGSSDINGAIIQLKHTANVALERTLLENATQIGTRLDWLKARKHILIPFASELGIEEEIHAIK